MLIIALVLFIVGVWIWHHIQCNECFAAIDAWCDTGDAFSDWRLRNQGVYVGLSEEGRMLVHHHLNAYDWFLRTHKFIDGRKYREWLIGFLHDFPPKHPDGIPNKNKRGIQEDALSFTRIYPIASAKPPNPQTLQPSQWFENRPGGRASKQPPSGVVLVSVAKVLNHNDIVDAQYNLCYNRIVVLTISGKENR